MKAKTKREELHSEASELGQPPELSEAPMQPDLQEQIRLRAYELSQQRDGNGGDALSDWYRAEAEIQAGLGASEFNNLSETKTKAGG